MTDAAHPDDPSRDRDPELGKTDRAGPSHRSAPTGTPSPNPPSPNPMPNGLVLGEPRRRWRLFAAMVAAARATRLPVLVVGSGPDAVRGLNMPVLSGLPMSVAGRPGETHSYRRAIERFLDGDPVEAGGQSVAARRIAEGRALNGGGCDRADPEPSASGERVSG